MVSQLAEYIKEQVANGYTVDQVRTFLIQQGYNQQTIDYAVNELNSGDTSKKQKMILLALIIVGVLVVVTAIVYLLLSGNQPASSVNSIPNTNPPPSPLPDVKNTSGPITPSVSKYPAHCSNKIEDSGELGTDCGGGCPVCEDFGDQQPTVNTPPTADTTPPTPIDNFSPTDTGLDQLNKIKEEAKNSPVSAATKCKTLREALQDDCYNAIAEISNQSSYCQGILKDDMRDSCYINFVIAKDYSVCPKITNPRIRDNCNALRDISTASTLVAAGKAVDVYSIYLSRNQALLQQLKEI